MPDPQRGPARSRASRARASRSASPGSEPVAVGDGVSVSSRVTPANGKVLPAVPVRPLATRRMGRRRAVGPVIGDELATQLLEGHHPDVLLGDRCACGLAFPCPSRAFATSFITDEVVPPVEPSPTAKATADTARTPRRPGPRHARRNDGDRAPATEEKTTELPATRQDGAARHSTLDPSGARTGRHAPAEEAESTGTVARLKTGSTTVAVAV